MQGFCPLRIKITQFPSWFRLKVCKGLAWFLFPQGGLTLQALRVTSVKFLFVISLLYKKKWSWELRTWSHKMNLIDTSTNSPHYFYWKRMRITNQNLNFDIRVWRVNLNFFHFKFSVREAKLIFLMWHIMHWLIGSFVNFLNTRMTPENFSR